MAHGRLAIAGGWLIALATMVVVVAHLLVSGFALAQAPRELPGVLGRDDRTPLDSSAWPWRAVGRLNQGTGAHCTAALIAPDAVLTAAHCVFHARSGRLLNPREVHFVAGYRRGDYLAHGRGRALHVAPGFAFTRQPQLDDIANDWVIIRLEQPLEIRPIPLRALPGNALTAEVKPHLQRVGYDQDRAHLLSLHDGCRLLDLVADDRVLVTDCDGPRGASGSPLLFREGGQVWIVGVTSAIGEGRLGGTTLAVHAGPLVDRLMPRSPD